MDWRINFSLCIYNFQVPLHKEPDWLWNTIDRWLQTCSSKVTDSIPAVIKGKLEQGNLISEAEWLKNRLEAENSPVVFCHNDMQEGNILISRDVDVDLENDLDDDVVIIGKFIFISTVKYFLLKFGECYLKFIL